MLVARFACADLYCICVFVSSSPVNPRLQLVKRVVATEGELVQWASPSSFLIDTPRIWRGLPLSDLFYRTTSYSKRLVQVPSGHCWIEGDNIRGSQDSNFFGPVSKKRRLLLGLDEVLPSCFLGLMWTGLRLGHSCCLATSSLGPGAISSLCSPG